MAFHGVNTATIGSIGIEGKRSGLTSYGLIEQRHTIKVGAVTLKESIDRRVCLDAGKDGRGVQVLQVGDAHSVIRAAIDNSWGVAW